MSNARLIQRFAMLVGLHILVACSSHESLGDPKCLLDRSKWQQAFHGLSAAPAGELGRQIWDHWQEWTGGFTYSRTEYFSCGGDAHWVVIAVHDRTGLEFSLLPGGYFMMGSDPARGGRIFGEMEGRWVKVPPFLLCRTELTNGLYRRWKKDHDSGIWGKGFRVPQVKVNGDREPVVDIGEQAAGCWCAEMGLQLPSEKQWEYGCRAGTSSNFFWGDGQRDAGEYANTADKSFCRKGHALVSLRGFRIITGRRLHTDDGYDGPAPVGAFKPNAFGLFDMIGNAAEITRTGQRGGSQDFEKETTALRGGSWGSGVMGSRCAARLTQYQNSFYHKRSGFRPASCSIGLKEFLEQRNLTKPVARTLPVGKESPASRSQVKREKGVQVPVADLDGLVKGNSTFALDLFRVLSKKENNLLFSPFSISAIHAQVEVGARGKTSAQMEKVFHFDLPPDRFHQAFNQLEQNLAASPLPGDLSTLIFANSFWAQTGFPFRQTFLDTLARNYGAGIQLVDFKGDPVTTCDRINQWVDEKTWGKINEVISPINIPFETKMILANTVFFKGDWEKPFAVDMTSNAQFNLLNGKQKPVEMMAMDGAKKLDYGKGPGYQVVELPYQGLQTAMVVIVPDTGKYKTFEQSMTILGWQKIINSMRQREVHLRLPKFEYTSQFSLGNTLSRMGMPDLFSLGKADLSGMSSRPGLFIANVIHKTTVAVNELGTEAAAVSVAIGVWSLPPEPEVKLTIDRPFIYMIRDLKSGTILFLGRLLAPGTP